MAVVPATAEVTADAQIVWLALCREPHSLDMLAAGLAYRAGLAGESPPLEDGTWTTRARAALAELQLLEMIEPMANAGGGEWYRLAPVVTRPRMGPPAIQNLGSGRSAARLPPLVPNMMPVVNWAELEKRLLASLPPAEKPARRRGR